MITDRGFRRPVLTAAFGLAVAALGSACVIPPVVTGPRPAEEANPAPDVKLFSFDQQVYGAGSSLLAYSTTRDAYSAVFEVDQLGRIRVITPGAPSDEPRVQGGKGYLIYPQLHSADREFLPASSDFSRVPFVFVLSSDTPLELSIFGVGRSWTHQLRTTAADPDSVIADVAARVLPGVAAYGSDFAYVGPRLRAGERAFAAQCVRPAEDPHDYQYFRALWAVFTPSDQSLGINPYWTFGPSLAWSSYSFLPVAAYRAQLAPAAFYPGCGDGVDQLWNSRYQLATFFPGLLSGVYGGWSFRPFGVPGIGTSGLPGRVTPRTTVAAVPLSPLHPPKIPLALAGGVVASVPGASPNAAGLPSVLGWRVPNAGRVAGEPREPGRWVVEGNGPGQVRAYAPRVAQGSGGAPNGGGARQAGERQYDAPRQQPSAPRPEPAVRAPTPPPSSQPVSQPTSAGASVIQSRNEGKNGSSPHR